MEDARLLVTFTDVSREDYEALRAADNRQQVRQQLAHSLRVNEEDGFHAVILLDFHYANYLFCLGHHFNAEKTSTVLSIQKVVYESSIALQRERNSDGKQKLLVNREVSYDLFRSLVLKHSCQRPPYAIGIFSAEECRIFTEYFRQTFFHHYKMYQYAYQSRYEVDIRVKDKCIVPASIPRRQFTVEDEIDPSVIPELADYFAKVEEANGVADSMFATAETREETEYRQETSVRTALDRAAEEVLDRAKKELKTMSDELLQTITAQ